MKTYLAKFAYSGSKSREFFDKEFECPDGEDPGKIVNDYVANQNIGETKSDRIRLWSMKEVPVSERAVEERAIGFAEWIAYNQKWIFNDEGKWFKRGLGVFQTPITTQELFALFQQQQSK